MSTRLEVSAAHLETAPDVDIQFDDIRIVADDLSSEAMYTVNNGNEMTAMALKATRII